MSEEKNPEVIEAKVEKKELAAPPAPIGVKEQALAFNDNSELMRFIDTMIRAKAIPKHLENREQVVAAWNYAAQLKLPPQPSLRQVAVIHGSPSIFGDLPLSLAQRHPDYEWHKEYCIDSKYNPISVENKNLNEFPFAGVCTIKRKGMEKPETYSFTWEEATRAGINDPKTSKGYDTVWGKYPQIMLVRRARSIALKAHFSDALAGANIAEYETGRAPDLEQRIKDVSPSMPSPDENKADILNRQFGKRDNGATTTQAV